MKRKLLGAALGLALLFPAVVEASKVNLSGNVTGGGTISLSSKHGANGKYTVINLKLASVPIDCTTGPYTFGANTKGFVFQVDSSGNFGANLVPTNQNPPKNHLKIAGKLTHHGTKASGTLRLHGDQVLTSSGQQDGCDTGTVNWSAK